jgi:small subunit ribosomal protein S16
MVRIRLRRTGLTHQPTYRVVVADKESPRDGRFIEILGSYNPRTNPFTLDIDEERAYHWMSVGAQPSESLVKLFKSAGIMARYERVKAGEDQAVVLADAKTAIEARNATIKASVK